MRREWFKAHDRISDSRVVVPEADLDTHADDQDEFDTVQRTDTEADGPAAELATLHG